MSVKISHLPGIYQASGNMVASNRKIKLHMKDKGDFGSHASDSVEEPTREAAADGQLMLSH